MLLPLGHDETIVRRPPWVSISVLLACVAVQIHAEVVMPGLEARGTALVAEMRAVEQEAIAAHAAETSPEERKAQQLHLLERVAAKGNRREQERILIDSMSGPFERFRSGELTGRLDPRFQRYQELSAELEALKQEVPALRFGYRPVLDGVPRMLSSAYTHAGWLHLLGNMWFLYLVGCNLEDRWGRWQFLLFYTLAGCMAALGFTMLHAESDQALVGASGAVAGAMGAFMVCFGRTKVRMLFVYMLLMRPRVGTFQAPAWALLLLWMLEQFVMTYVEAAAGTPVAYSAHAAGFMFGAVVAFLLRKTGVDLQLDEASERIADAEREVWSEHALYLEATELRSSGKPNEAVQALTELLSEVPDHIPGCEALFELGLARNDVRAIDLSLPCLIDSYHRQHAHERLCELARELRAEQPSYGLTDQELLRVASAAAHVGDGSVVIHAVTELMEQHPESVLVPRALWVAAETQGRLGAPEHQRETLGHILQRFPKHACATLARDQLGRMGAT